MKTPTKTKQYHIVIAEKLKHISENLLTQNLLTANKKVIKKLVFKEINTRRKQ